MNRRRPLPNRIGVAFPQWKNSPLPSFMQCKWNKMERRYADSKIWGPRSIPNFDSKATLTRRHKFGRTSVSKRYQGIFKVSFSTAQWRLQRRDCTAGEIQWDKPAISPSTCWTAFPQLKISHRMYKRKMCLEIDFAKFVARTRCSWNATKKSINYISGTQNCTFNPSIKANSDH